MRFRVAVVAGALAALSGGCSLSSSQLAMYAIPPFSPVAPQEGVKVYQVRWIRSWKPTIHVIAWQQSMNGRNRAWVAYGAFEGDPGPLSYEEIDVERWDEIERAASRSGFWDYDSSCDETAYRTDSLFGGSNGECEELILTDGAIIEIAASNGASAKGITSICPNLELCEPLGELPLAVLSMVGRDSLALDAN
jgi:hypothetical protein